MTITSSAPQNFSQKWTGTQVSHRPPIKKQDHCCSIIKGTNSAWPNGNTAESTRSFPYSLAAHVRPSRIAGPVIMVLFHLYSHSTWHPKEDMARTYNEEWAALACGVDRKQWGADAT